MIIKVETRVLQKSETNMLSKYFYFCANFKLNNYNYVRNDIRCWFTC
jgi:hypothetical protein